MILVVIDTLRRSSLSCYGSATATPNIDALAERGQLFRNALASYHQTSMSMASLFTGRTPSIEFGALRRPLFWNGETWCGMNRFAEESGEGMCVPPTLPTLAEGMREAGYWTIGIASNQFLYEPSGFARGFDDWVEVGEHPEKKGAIARIELTNAPETRHGGLVNRSVSEALNRRESDRFFLYVHYMDVHDYGFAKPSRDWKIHYAASVAAVDAALGRLMGALGDEGLLEDAMIVLTADHGERLGERHALRGEPGHGGNPSFQEVLDVPLLVAPATGRDPDRVIRTEDVYRLILEEAGAPSAVPPELAAGELLLAETGFRTYIHDRWKSVIRREDGRAYLFDLSADPAEMSDLAPQNPEIVEAHRTRIEALSRRFSARRAVLERISPLDRARLKALGYGYEPGDADETQAAP